MPEQRGCALAFDFGLKCIGVAVGQKVSCSATPLAVLSAQNGNPDWPAVDALIDDYQPIALVVGIPLNMDDTEQHLTHCARAFANQLKKRYSIPVHRIDERLTTVAAKERAYHEQGPKAGRRQQRLDALAAQIMLEDWLAAQDM